MHLNTKQCCGHEFTANNIKGRLMSQQEALGTNNFHLWGGNAKKFAETVCPVCEKEYLMWLKPQGGNYRVLTISNLSSDNEEEKIVEVETEEEVETEVETDETETPKMSCFVCGKLFIPKNSLAKYCSDECRRNKHKASSI